MQTLHSAPTAAVAPGQIAGCPICGLTGPSPGRTGLQASSAVYGAFSASSQLRPVAEDSAMRYRTQVVVPHTLCELRNVRGKVCLQNVYNPYKR